MNDIAKAADTPDTGVSRGQWMALTAALLGWMFDGLEMGLFPLVAGPAIEDLLPQGKSGDVGFWFGIATAAFLIGAATGGVLFGWLGDRLGRVRAMTLSVLTYAIFSGACGFATSPEQIVVLRFFSALGMGGEWSLGVALVMEIWPDRSRAFMAGLIGAAANFGYLLIALLGLVLTRVLAEVQAGLLVVLPETTVASLTAHGGWRLLMFLGAMPALLTFFIRLFVPESERWHQEKARGSTAHWATRDLLGVLVGAAGGIAIIFIWALPPAQLGWEWRIILSIPALAVATVGYMYPVVRYVRRASEQDENSTLDVGQTIRRLLLGAALGGIPLLGTWAAIQQAPTWAYEMTKKDSPTDKALWQDAKGFTQAASAGGAIVGTILAALAGGWLGRRITYFLLCVFSLGSAWLLYQESPGYGNVFLLYATLAGGFTASFYGWLPLYLPELFPTKVRATGQGFSFNFGRVIAAVGALQGGYLINTVYHGDFAKVCSIMSLIYIVGMGVIWLAPETKGLPLPE
jgi:MFS transporter, SHS family, sialic acid transporter